jgi:hypothetical protein
MDEVGVVLDTGRLTAIGPSEFRVLSPQSDQIFAATNLASGLVDRGLHPDEVLALRGWAEKREQAETKVAFDRAGKPAAQQRGVDVRLVVHEELLGPTAVIAETWAEVPVDPFAEHPTSDDLPELRHWVIKLTEAVLAEAEPRLRTVSIPTDPGFTFQSTLRDEERFGSEGRASLEAELMPMDPLLRESALLDRVFYLYPDATPAEANALAQLPTGLLVGKVRSEEATKSGLRTGDLITEVEGEPAVGPQTLHRWLALRPEGSKLRLAILRGPDRVNLVLPVPR